MVFFAVLNILECLDTNLLIYKNTRFLRHSGEVGHFRRIVIFQMSLFVKATINVLEIKMFQKPFEGLFGVYMFSALTLKEKIKISNI